MAFSSLIFLSLPFFLVSLVNAELLPSFRAETLDDTHKITSDLEAAKKWWFRVGDFVYHRPDEHKVSLLSTNISNYYYAMGSHSALNEELRASRVGGLGRWHIFYLPEGPTKVLTSIGETLGRRASMSQLMQLKHGVVLPSEFPKYESSKDYANPLSDEGQAIEKQAVKSVTADIIEAYLEKIVGLKSRSMVDSSATEGAVSLLESEFESLGLQTCRQDFEATGFRLSNVIAFVPGKGNESSDIVVVGAHYDSRPFDGAAPGAEDNGSGSAVLLALAKAFAEAKITPKKSVYFVAFGGEEGGLFGSTAFVGALNPKNKSTAGIPKKCSMKSTSFMQKTGKWTPTELNVEAIIMDEIGWVSPSIDKETVNLESYDTTQHVMDHLMNACVDHNGDGLQVVHSNNPFGSDHMPFLNDGMQAVLTINGDDEGYPAYHQSTDTIDNVSPEYTAKIAKMNMGALIRMAGIHKGSSSSSFLLR